MKVLAALLLSIVAQIASAQNYVYIGLNPVLAATPIANKFEEFRAQSNINDVDNSDSYVNVPRLNNMISFGLSVGYKRQLRKRYSLSAGVDFANYNIRTKMYSKQTNQGSFAMHRFNIYISAEKKIPIYPGYYISPLIGFGYNKPLNNYRFAGLWSSGHIVGVDPNTGDTLINEYHSHSYEYSLVATPSYFYRFGIVFSKVFGNFSSIELGAYYDRTFSKQYNFESYKFYGELFGLPYENTWRRDSSPYFRVSNLFLNIKYLIPLAVSNKNKPCPNC